MARRQDWLGAQLRRDAGDTDERSESLRCCSHDNGPLCFSRARARSLHFVQSHRCPAHRSLPMHRRRYLQSALIGVCARCCSLAPSSRRVTNGLVFCSAAPATWRSAEQAALADSGVSKQKASAITALSRRAIDALVDAVGPLSTPDALPDAIRSYFAYKAAHPGRGEEAVSLLRRLRPAEHRRAATSSIWSR